MTCTTPEAKPWPAKEPGAALDYYVDFTPHLARWREPRKSYAQGVRFRVRGVAGFEYEVTTAGETSLREDLIFPQVDGVTVRDGSTTLTCRTVSTLSLVATLGSAPVWTCSDPALVITNQAYSGQIASADISGGIDGADYEVIVTAAYGSSKTLPVVCVLPVRRAQPGEC